MDDIHLTLLSGTLVFFPPAAVASIPHGDDFFELNLADPQQACDSINLGLIGVIDFGGQGTFWLRAMRRDAAAEELLREYSHSVKIPSAVLGGGLYFRDLYETYTWDSSLESTPMLPLGDGFYDLEIATRVQPGMSIGCDQEVLLLYQKEEAPVNLNLTSVPKLY